MAFSHDEALAVFTLELISSAIGFAILFLRLGPAIARPVRSQSRRYRNSLDSSEPQDVSIIVPARNEEANLPHLLCSLSRIRAPNLNLEVIVVDDESTDRTREIARHYSDLYPDLNLKLVDGSPPSEGWTGKNWACHQGYLKSCGTWLLFTDADTVHEPEGLVNAVQRMRQESVDLLSATPFHACETVWERLLGPFHLLLFIGTAAMSRPRPGRVFSIGQYLLFKRGSYERQGGHENVRSVLCEDLELAHQCLRLGGVYRVETRIRMFRVRMYRSLREFIHGWRRNFRLGFKSARPSMGVEIYFVICALTASLRGLSAHWSLIAFSIASLVMMASSQKRFGNFSMAGVVLFPWSLLIFVTVSLLAAFDLVMCREFKWRDRTYPSAG